ncbi:MAG: 50S ribosomal protein L21, partial [Flavobacteriales bacterium]|nr:50S ribosomal protein L21 [Flavobacteriales bacterium]
MIAILNIDGRQLKVEKNQEFYVSKISGKEGDELTFESVALIQDGDNVTSGNPLVEGAQVKVSILEQKKDDKIIVFKKKRRKGYKVKNGHRQMITKIKIDSISIGGKTKKTTTKKTTAEKTTAEKTTTKKTTAEKTTTKKTTAKKTTAKKTTAKKTTAK